MKVHRTLPPTAAPLSAFDILNGLAGIFIGKMYLKKLQMELEEYFGVEHVFLVSSGKAALTIILNALKTIDSRQEVIIPAYTCYSVPAAIIKAGLNISLCDIEPDTFDFNYEQLEKKINENTLCIVPSNLFGIPSDIDKIKRHCRTKGIYLIEDAAQAMGGIYKEKLIGTNGDVGFFSLGRGKNITSGAGGIIITNSDQIAAAINKYYSVLKSTSKFYELFDLCKLSLMSIFIHPSLYWLPSGLSFLKIGETIYPKQFPVERLSGSKAGILKKWKENLIKSERCRQENVDYFNDLIKPIRPSLRIPIVCESTKERNRIIFRSVRKGLGLSLMYPAPINEIEEIREKFNGEAFPIAKMVSERLVTIPTHHFINELDKQEILNTFLSH